MISDSKGASVANLSTSFMTSLASKKQSHAIRTASFKQAVITLAEDCFWLSDNKEHLLTTREDKRGMCMFGANSYTAIRIPTLRLEVLRYD